MDGRNRHPLSRSQFPPPHFIEDLHRNPYDPTSRPHPVALMEDRIDRQHREIQALLLDNQRFGATHVALKQEVSAAQQELRHLAATAQRVKAEREAQVQEIYERSLVLEAEARSVGAMKAELVQVREDNRKLNVERTELSEKLRELNGELARVRAESQLALIIKEEIEIMHQELQKGRAAIEHEKKNHAENLKHRQSMEKNMVIMAREIEKLRAELANAEKRARAAAAVAAAANPGPGPGYAGSYGNSEMGYGGNYHADPYSMSQVHGGVDGDFPYGSRAFSHGPM